MASVSRGLDRIDVTFDDPSLVADAGLIVPATLMVRLGLEELVNATVRLAGRVGGARPGRKVLTLVATILAGGSHIDHADRLRAGATHAGPALPGDGAFDTRNVPALVHLRACPPARRGDRRDDPSGLGARRRSGPLAHDDRHGLDDLRCVWQGQAGRRLRLHEGPRLSPPPGHLGSDRRGPPCSDAQGLVAAGPQAVHPRTGRPGASGRGQWSPRVRADSGFFSYALIDTLTRLGVGLVDHGPDQPPHPCLHRGHRRVGVAVHRLPRRRCRPGGRNHLCDRCARQLPARCAWSCGAPGSPTLRNRRCGPTGATTPSSPISRLPTIDVDKFHRDHARVELAIRDLKEGAGLEHCPSGRFFANAAWLGCAVLAHNLDPLDLSPWPRPPRRSPHRGPHRALSSDRPPGPAREPKRSARPAPARPVALGNELHRRPRPHPRLAPAHLNIPRRTGAAADESTR